MAVGLQSGLLDAGFASISRIISTTPNASGATRYDVFVFDIALPDGDGREFLASSVTGEARRRSDLDGARHTGG